jgi:transposase
MTADSGGGVVVSVGVSAPHDRFGLVRRRVDALPVVNEVLRRLRLVEIADRYLPARDARVKIDPAVVVAVLVRNVLLGHQPGYAVGQWAASFDPALLGLTGPQAGLLTDDRLAAVLDQLFDADRASLLTELVLRAIDEFGVDTSQCHNDSTSVTFQGTRPDRGGGRRGGKAVPALKHGHNKDHRPDLPQLLWILTVAADGAVPILHRVVDGNLTDDTTHIHTWNSLVKLLGHNDFLYVADSKLATREQMDHIHRHRGRFIAPLPRSRSEDSFFRTDWIVNHNPGWAQARRRPGPRHDDPPDVWSVLDFAHPSAEGYRIIWVHSTRRAEHDAADRTRRIRQASTALDELNQRLASPRCRLRDLPTIDTAATAEIDRHQAIRWISCYVDKTEQVVGFKSERSGRPGPDTRYRRITRPQWTIHYSIDHDAITRDAASDGCYPLITNDRTLTAAEILDAFKHQPHLERRHRVLKTDHDVMPMFRQRPHRIEALLCCHFIALLTAALLERELRNGMRAANIEQLPLYPELRACTAPTATRILDLFTHLTRDELHDHAGNHLQTFQPQLTDLQRQVLTILGMPPSIYQT